MLGLRAAVSRVPRPVPVPQAGGTPANQGPRIQGGPRSDLLFPSLFFFSWFPFCSLFISFFSPFFSGLPNDVFEHSKIKENLEKKAKQKQTKSNKKAI